MNTLKARSESRVTLRAVQASGELEVSGTQDVNRNGPAGFATVNNGALSGSAKPVA